MNCDDCGEDKDDVVDVMVGDFFPGADGKPVEMPRALCEGCREDWE